MSTFIVGFICALILAALVILWIAYCMFCKEKHKSENHQYDISDLQRRNYILGQEEEEKSIKKEITAGVFILPSRHKQKDEYDKRPDYPESPVSNWQPSTGKLIEIFNDNPADDSRKCVGFDLESPPYHSDV